MVSQPVNSGTCFDTSSVSATPLEFLDTIDSDDNDDDVSSVYGQVQIRCDILVKN